MRQGLLALVAFSQSGLALDRNRTLLFMNSGPNTYAVYISSYRESSGFFMDFASTFGQISMTICPREHHGSRPGAFRNIRPVGGRAPAGSGTCADGVRQSDFRPVPPPAKSQPPGGMARLERLIAAGAWTDAALVLIELELPAWSLRRLIREDDEWFCSLSRQPNVPVALDVTAHAHHAGSHHATSGKHTPA